MTATIIVFVIIGLIITGILVNPLLIKWQQDNLKRRLFPPLWNAIIENNLPIYNRLSPGERRRLQGHILIFLASKQFLGCGGLQVTEEIKVIIASVACLLLLNEQGKYFAKLRSILIYPSAYFVNETTSLSNYIIEERRVIRLGESWARDQLVLSWEQVKQDTYNWHDGQNVILHEFAHQLDQEDGKTDGVPILQQNSDYAQWAEGMTAEYQQLCHDIQTGKNTVINSYGATNPAEFFAVVTETFFEKPQQLFEKHSLLYQQLQQYYQLDPRQWL